MIGRAPGLAGVLVALGVVGLACGADESDSAAATTVATAEAEAQPEQECPDQAIPLSADALTAELVLPVEFVDGAVETDSAMAGHTHRGPLVEDRQAHVHYCLAVANGFEHPVSLSAIQVLPDRDEEPLAIVEADALADAFVVPREGERIAATGYAVLEILVPADGPVERIHQRIAYTVEDAARPRDLFLDITLPPE